MDGISTIGIPIRHLIVVTGQQSVEGTGVAQCGVRAHAKPPPDAIRSQLVPRNLPSPPPTHYHSILHSPSQYSPFSNPYFCELTVVAPLALSCRSCPPSAITMSDHQRPAVTHPHRPYDQYSTQPSRQTVKSLTAATIGVTLFFLSGLTLTGTVLGLVLATPVLILFSPILVPAAIALFLAAGGLLFSGVCGVAAVAAFSWIYNYVARKHPAGADKHDYARVVLGGDRATDVKERGKDYGHYGQGRGQDANAQGRGQDPYVQVS